MKKKEKFRRKRDGFNGKREKGFKYEKKEKWGRERERKRRKDEEKDEGK